MKKNKPKIVLIAPSVIGAKNQVRKAPPPLGIACLAAVLEEKGYEDILLIDAVVEDYNNVVILEDEPSFVKFGLSDENIVRKIKEFDADIVGLSSLFSSQTEWAMLLAKAIKAAFPEMPVILGGNHASQMGEEILREEQSIDFVLAGEADYTFPEFLEKSFNDGDIYQIPGLVWREGDEIRKNQRPAFIKDLNALPLPAWHLYDMEKYFEIGMPHNPFVRSDRVGCIITSRGCPHKCYYCSTPEYLGHVFRHMSSERVIEMIQYLVDKYGIEELQVLDDTFTINYKRVLEVLDGIKHLKLRITFPNGIRADLPRNHEKRLRMFKAMQIAGVEQVGLSVEHADQEFLNNVYNFGLYG